MIKLVSPKYMGSVTSASIKSRVVELLFCWRTDLPNEPKIKEAYELLKTQQVLKEDPVYIGPLHIRATPRPKASVEDFQNELKSKELKRLLQSKRPEDLDKANSLIKEMVYYDEIRSEKQIVADIEIEKAKNNVKVLDEMLTEYEKNKCSESHLEIMKEVYAVCDDLEKNISYSLLGSTHHTLENIKEIRGYISRVTERYKRLVDKSYIRPAEKETLSRKSSENSNCSKKVEDVAKASDVLLDLSSPVKEKQKVSNEFEKVLNNNLADLDLVTSSADSKNVDVTSESTASLTLLECVSTVSDTCKNENVVSDKSFNIDMNNLIKPMTPLSNVSKPMIVNSGIPTEQPRSPPNPLDSLDILGSNLLKDSMPQDLTFGNSFKQPVKISINQLIEQVSVTKKFNDVDENPINITLDYPDLLNMKNETDTTTTTGKDEIRLKTDANHVTKSLNKAQLIEVKPLNDISLSIAEISTSDREPVVLFSGNSLTVTLFFTNNKPRPDVDAFVLSLTSRNSDQVDKYLMQVGRFHFCS